MDCKNPPDTVHRVFDHTSEKINQKIRRDTIQRLNDDVDDDASMISERIRELNEEWDTERVLEAYCAGLVLAGTVLSLTKCKWGLILAGAAGCSLMKHALHGWCPSLPLIRSLGIRTSEEIYNEKTVLKQIRGDFSQVTSSVPLMLEIAERQ
ncbi:DUF2892 domain-containing protein [Caproiciproducens sp. LBM24188]